MGKFAQICPCGNRQAGFSTLEILTTVAIIGIVTALALPDFTQARARTELRQSVIELQSNLNMARMVAMNRDTTVTVTFAILGNGRVQASFQGFLPPYTMPVSITGFGGANPIRFNSYGMLVGVVANQQISLTSQSGLVYSVQVTPGGRTKWCASPTCT
jgi:type II secretory pathway pseudopilin PulG